MQSFLASKSSVRKLGERLKDGSTGSSDQDTLNSFRSFVASYWPQAHMDVARACDSALPGRSLVAGRIKRSDAIVRKLRRRGSSKLTNMADIVGLRVIVPCLDDVVTVRLALDEHPHFALPPKFQDYVVSPQDSGYRALHVFLTYPSVLPGSGSELDVLVEIQVRTYLQHLWASVSEGFGQQVKEGGGKPAVRQFLARLSHAISEYEDSSGSSDQVDLTPLQGPLQFFAMQFDTAGKELVRCDSIGSSIGHALELFEYLESDGSKSATRETVLLGSQGSESDIRVTHVRYFAPRGLPELPGFITDKVGFPSQILLAA